MRPILAFLALLMIWGPPRLRFEGRPLGAALEAPFEMDASALLQVCVWGLSAFVVALCIAGRGLGGRSLVPPLIWASSLRFYFAYGLLALVSTCYSVSPFYTIFFAGKIVVSILTVGALTTADDLSARFPLVLKLFFWVNVGQWLLNVLLFFVDPNLVGAQLVNVGYRMAGGILEDYGTAAAMAGVFFLSMAVFYARGRMRLAFVGLYGLTWISLTFSRTRSTIIGAIVVFVLMVVLHRRLSTRLFVSLGSLAAILVIIAIGALDTIVAYGLRAQDISSLMTLTGRVQAFEFLWEVWNDAPWLGYGYGAGTRYHLVQFVQQSGLGIGSAHDAASKVLVDLGIVGAAVLGFVFISAWKEVLQLFWSVRTRPDLRPLATLLLVLMAFFSMTNIVAGGIAEAPYPFLIVSAVAGVLARRRAVVTADSIKVRAGL